MALHCNFACKQLLAGSAVVAAHGPALAVAGANGVFMAAEEGTTPGACGAGCGAAPAC